MLSLPQEVRDRYDVSSMRWLIHGAAPTPVHVKHKMIEWFGPVVWEYYAATEGGTFLVDSFDWLKKPGSVGRTVEGTKYKVLDDDGQPVPTGTTGTVYFAAAENRFVYFKAPEKTDAAYRDDFFTMGDMGYVDEDGYLFLTGRSAETIIAGGVNIYPQEIDDVLQQHPRGVRGLHRRRAPRGMGRERQVGGRGGRKLRSRRRTGRGASRLVPREPARLQAPALHRLRNRPAAHAHGQDKRGLVRAPYWKGRERANLTED